MKAAVYEAPGEVRIEEVTIDQPMPHEVLVQTAAAGVCHSDLHQLEGRMPPPPPRVLGHEVSGVVKAVGSQVTYVMPGDHVVACLSIFCGQCVYCLSGRLTLCQSSDRARKPGDPPRLSADGRPIGQFADIGGFAEQMLVHENALVKIDKDLRLDTACLVGCGVLTGVGAVINSARVHAGSRVVVIGLGGVGLSAVQGAVLAGARQIIAVDVFDRKLQMASAFGATDVINARDGDPVAAILELTHGGVEYAFEAIGTPLTAQQAFNCLAPGGLATIVGWFPPGEMLAVEGRRLFLDRAIRGCYMGGNRFRTDIPAFLELYRRGRLKLDELMSRRASLEDVEAAFQAMRAGEVARTVLILSEELAGGG